MAHPIAWSGKPAKLTSEGGPTEQSAIGMTQFTASVNFHSDPMSERIVTEPQALALFRLFFHKCHPSFPLLEPGHDLGSYFANMRSSSPFLFTVILMIAGRYYPKYREFEFSKASLPEITIGHIEAINDLAISHLGFVLVRKQHQLSDVQAAILFAVWIPRGDAYRIELPDSGNHPLITRFLESSQVGPEDIQNANNIVNQWHTWLIIHLHDTFLSLGFGRPHTTASPSTYPQQYLALVRKLGSSSCIVPTSAAHVASLAELSLIATDLISGLQEARLPPKPSTVRTPDQDHQRDVAIPCLTRACEATVAIVQLYTEGSDIDLIIRFGTDYLILILGQAAVFLIRLLAVRTKLPLPFDPLVLVHYFQKAVELLESNDVSKTGICGWVARLSRDLARHAGILFDAEPGQTSVNSSVPDFGPTDLNWDFDISALIGQELLVEESGLDLVQYLSFSQPFIPPS
ncbi:hypothetical protein N7475_007879 [Penicillium sp. IBT 31633x]|nr:hypothetical protein N7475_007879 [Penicillium sp. IBT 31633x]